MRPEVEYIDIIQYKKECVVSNHQTSSIISPKKERLSDAPRALKQRATGFKHQKRCRPHTGLGVVESKKKNSLLHQVHLASKLIPSAIIPLPPFPFRDFLSPSVALQLLPLIM